MPVQEIMRMEMSVLGFPVEVGVPVDEGHSEQKVLICQNFIGTPYLLDSVVL